MTSSIGKSTRGLETRLLEEQGEVVEILVIAELWLPGSGRDTLNHVSS